MGTVNSAHAKTNFGSILDRVAAGEEIVITRHDKPVARIVPEGRHSLESVREAVEGLRALRERMARRKGFRPVTDAEIRSAINEGRR
jgi:prevent-host-death family protein